MQVGHLLVGVAAYFGLFVGVALAMWIAGRVTARVLGVARFRWFREPEQPTPQWKLVVVRLAAALAPWVVSVLLFWLALVTEGVPAAPTTRVEVLPGGGASRAGMVTGDRVLAIGGRSVTTWEALRAAVPQNDEPVAIELERAGQRLELQVTPRHGRIGVSPQSLVARVGAVEAMKRAVGMPLTAASRYAVGLLHTAMHQEHPDLAGPVAIMRQTSRAGESGWLIQYLALLAAYFAAFFGGVPLFDLATALLFRSTYRDAAPGIRAYQLERIRQALLFAAAAEVVMLAVSPVVALEPLLVLALVPFSSIALALFPLIWSGGSLVWGRAALILFLCASALVPCAVLFVVLVLHRELSRALVKEGADVSWWRMRLPA